MTIMVSPLCRPGGPVYGATTPWLGSCGPSRYTGPSTLPITRAG
jgi:hypothetical protein